MSHAAPRSPAAVLATSRPSDARLAFLAERYATKQSINELERYAAVSSGWVREMWIAAIAVKRGPVTRCDVYGARHQVVFQRALSEACDLYACHCGWERAWADVDATHGEHPEYVIIDTDEEAALLGALPA